MITLYEIFGILILHWFADFILQTEEQSKMKSKDISYLIGHTLTYSFVMFFGIMCIVSLNNIYTEENVFTYIFYMFLFGTTTFFFHTLTDYFTSKWTAKLWKQNKVHTFFVVIGFDQFLHYLQLFLTYKILFL